MVTDLFSRDELKPALDDIEQLVEDLAQKLYKHGKITSIACDLNSLNYRRFEGITHPYVFTLQSCTKNTDCFKGCR